MENMKCDVETKKKIQKPNQIKKNQLMSAEFG